jgi:hypothetical protein
LKSLGSRVAREEAVLRREETEVECGINMKHAPATNLSQYHSQCNTSLLTQPLPVSGWSAGSTRRRNSSTRSHIASASACLPMSLYVIARWFMAVPARQIKRNRSPRRLGPQSSPPVTLPNHSFTVLESCHCCELGRCSAAGGGGDARRKRVYGWQTGRGGVIAGRRYYEGMHQRRHCGFVRLPTQDTKS